MQIIYLNYKKGSKKMNDEIVDIIFNIAQKIGKGECTPYYYDKGIFRLVDKDNNVNIQVKYGDKSVSVTDYINGITYYTKFEKLQDDITISHIVYQYGEQLYYYRTLNVENESVCIKVLRKNNEGTLECTNHDVDWNDRNKVLELAATLRKISDEKKKMGVGLTISNDGGIILWDKIKRINTNSDKDSDELDENDENNSGDFVNVDTYGILRYFENMPISDFADFILKKQDNENKFCKDVIFYDEEELLEIYRNFKVTLNGEQADEFEGSIIAFYCDMASRNRGSSDNSVKILATKMLKSFLTQEQLKIRRENPDSDVNNVQNEDDEIDR